MPDYKKFMQLKSAHESMGRMLADYEKDFGMGEGDDISKEDAGDDKMDDINDGGQESLDNLQPQVDSSIDEDGETKKKKMAIGAMLSKKLSKAY